ncbi:hypothetical protein ARMGADRAFT_317382 [Armillaria gallica]|uniref:Uncharacterized protein n=1 Tax=Armillaria gallica TaxID=47427 RepID=A0A2H3D3H1_ARMGA|nr:hypothetical protein ARMGADRAFT_317382 [Armillaria gallica]
MVQVAYRPERILSFVWGGGRLSIRGSFFGMLLGCHAWYIIAARTTPSRSVGALRCTQFDSDCSDCDGT